jgi:hypothetical protein
LSAAKTAAAGMLSILFIVSIASLLLKVGFAEPAASPEAASPGGTLWDVRDFETILQGLLILGGVFAILMILRALRREGPV